MGSTSCSKGGSNEYYLNFIGNKKDFKDEAMFNLFDTDYINLDLLPYNYYPIHNKENLSKQELHFFRSYILNLFSIEN